MMDLICIVFTGFSRQVLIAATAPTVSSSTCLESICAASLKCSLLILETYCSGAMGAVRSAPFQCSFFLLCISCSKAECEGDVRILIVLVERRCRWFKRMPSSSSYDKLAVDASQREFGHVFMSFIDILLFELRRSLVRVVHFAPFMNGRAFILLRCCLAFVIVVCASSPP